jgi:hypothetical protein
MTGFEHIKINSRSGAGKHTRQKDFKTLHVPRTPYSGVGLVEKLFRPFGW